MLRQIIHTTLYTLLAISLLAMGSCVTEEREIPTPQPTRVLLAYIGVDNNLSGFEQEKIDGLRNGWTGKKTDRIFAYIDNRTDGAKLYDLSVDATSDPLLLSCYGAEDSASAETFSRVVVEVISNYKAESYGLLVFSHASGWLPQGALTNPHKAKDTRSIIIDGTKEMELADFAHAIPDGVFDYIAFEACFMAGIEVAYELRNKADYILASSAEIVHPGFAPVYEASTGKLLTGNLTGFGQSVFNHTLTYAETELQHSATYSVIQTSKLQDLADFIRLNCDFEKEITITEIQHFDRYSYRLFFDFEGYYGRLLEADTQRAELARLIDNCVTWKAATPGFMNQQSGYNGFTINNHSGLTTYIPQEQFTGLNEAYNGLSWTKAITLQP